ncbi:MAG TPA: ATP-binding cassette domain-containing protein [Syntrophales bacterium]|nr:ATP-binding cassette domain-containing protein [Syntrophales bacterium]
MGLTAVLKKKTKFFTIDVELSCPDGQTLALIGPSGSGKTTIIRMLAGLVTPDEGRIVYRDRLFFDSARGVNLPPQKRKLGYVFQDYSLFPHLTLYGNAAFAARDRGEVDALMAFFGLAELRDRKPHQVSGGERQRCAVCQALARNPQLLLLDEPFSALDVVTRRILRNGLKRITEKRTCPVVYVTHDVTEALFIGNAVLPIVAGSVDREWMERITAPAAGMDAGAKAARATRLALAY